MNETIRSWFHRSHIGSRIIVPLREHTHLSLGFMFTLAALVVGC
jgi:hypothetical protein